MKRVTPSRRAVLRAAPWASAAGALALAACDRQDTPKAPAVQERATIRTLTRTPYDEEAWRLISEQDEHANVRTETEAGPDDPAPYGRKLLALAAADSLPDVIYVHPNFFSSIASKKLLADHEKLAAPAGFDLKGIQKELVDSVRWTDGKLYAVPYSGVSYLLVVNVGLFKQRGVTAPAELERQGKWDWEGFRSALRQLTSRAPDQPPVVGMPEHARGMQYLSHWIFGNGGEVWSKDLKTCLLDSPKTLRALEYVAELHGKDKVTPQPGEAEQFGTTSLQRGFESGRIGVYFRATTEVNQVRTMSERGAELGIAPVPRGPVARVPRGAGNAWGVVSRSRAPEAAFRAIAAWHRDPLLEHVYQQRLMFPCRQVQFEHPAFRRALFPWEDLEVEQTALRQVRIMATPDRFAEIDEQWNRLWVDALYGRRTVRDLLAEFLPQVNALLRG
jgi:multiple sugar transport system substrate-binding protein